MKQVTSKPWQVLQAVSSRKLSGCLTTCHIHNPTLGWQLHFSDGRLTYATSTKGALERIESLWQYLPEKLPFPNLVKHQGSNTLNFSPDFAPDFAKSDYQLLCDWKEQHQISITAFRSLLAYLTKEAIGQVLSYDLMTVQFESSVSLKPVLLAADIRDVVKCSLVNIKKWQTLRSFFPSPFAQINLHQDDVGKFFTIDKRAAPNQLDSSDSLTMSSWVQLLLKRLTLYGLAAETGLEPLQLAEWLCPYVKAGIVKATIDTYSIKPKVHVYKPLVVCVDDSKAVQRQMKMVLEMAGYEVLGIADPAILLSTLAKQQPRLILMDINMPTIDGYELTGMLKRSQKLRDVPIVMLTGRDGIIDRMRAQFVGAVDFLTKPVHPDRLIDLVNQLTRDKSQEAA
jgi:twitching motility two-component system response regulator PilG